MISRDIGSSSVRSAVLGTTAFAAIASALFSLTAIQLTSRAFRTESVTVDWSALQWVRGVRMDLERTDSPAVTMAPLPVVAIPQFKPLKPRLHLAKVARKHVDQVVAVQSHAEAVAAPAPAPVIIDTSAQMRQAYAMLRTQFRFALTTQIPSDRAPKLAATEDAPKSELKPVPTKAVSVPAQAPQAVKVVAQAQALPAQKAAAPEVLQKTPSKGPQPPKFTPPAIPAQKAVQVTEKRDSSKEAQNSALAQTEAPRVWRIFVPNRNRPSVAGRHSKPRIEEVDSSREETALLMEQAAVARPIPTTQDGGDYSRPAAAAPLAMTSQQTSGSLSQKQEAVAKAAGYSVSLPQSTNNILAIQPPVKQGVRAPTASKPTVLAKNDVSLSPSPKNETDVVKPGWSSDEPVTFSMTRSLLENETTEAVVYPAAVEAFDWNHTVETSTRDVYSPEGQVSGKQKRWTLTRSSGHLPTLMLTSAEERSDSVPLISANSSTLLAGLAKVAVDPQAGIVFGRIPSDWSVILSGVATPAVYLEDQTSVVNGVASRKYFVWLNVQPGAFVVTAVNEKQSINGSVGLPVIASTSTYLELSSPQIRAISGRVLDGGRPDAQGIAGVSVRLVGQAAPAAVTDLKGVYRIPKAVVFGDHPVFIETDHPSGYTHRYRVRQSAFDAAILYRFDEKKVQGWLSQLEGGVSVESGLVIAAVPGLAASVEPGAVLVPTIQSLQPTSSLVPEVYTLSSRDHLKVASVLSAEEPRFISVQVPRGPAMAVIEDRNRDTIFGEIFVSSPGVVNVLGPY